jgi:plastocyanin
VSAGTAITWTNLDKAPHTATARDESFDTGTLKKNQAGEIALDDPGTYAYYCRFHQFMNGTIEVG